MLARYPKTASLLTLFVVLGGFTYLLVIVLGCHTLGLVRGPNAWALWVAITCISTLLFSTDGAPHDD